MTPKIFSEINDVLISDKSIEEKINFLVSIQQWCENKKRTIVEKQRGIFLEKIENDHVDTGTN